MLFLKDAHSSFNSLKYMTFHVLFRVMLDLEDCQVCPAHLEKVYKDHL